MMWRKTLACLLGPGLVLAACRGSESPSGHLAAESASEGQPAEISRSPDADLADLCRSIQGSDNRYWGTRQVDRLWQQLRSLDNALGDANRLHLAHTQMLLGRELIRIGEYDTAARQLDSARQLGSTLNLGKDWRRSVLWLSAGAHLQLGLLRNCTATGGPNLCTLPLNGGGLQMYQQDSSAAIELLRQFHQLNADPRFELASAWLLNVAHLLIGTYPEGVPGDLLIPLERFTAPYAMQPMPDRAPALGVDALDLAGGSVIEDFDNDGFLDLVATTMDLCDHAKYYRNNGDGTFSDLSQQSGLAGQPGSLNLVQTDYDNDGLADLFLTRGAWLFADGRHRNSLLHNNGDGTFTDVTRVAGLADPAYPTQAAAWGDYDNDGFLDLYIGNEEVDPSQVFPGQLFHNNRNGTFSDVARQAGVENRRMAKGVAWGDYDNDGDLDLYVSNFGPNRLYENQGDGTFVDVAQELGVEEPAGISFATWFWDYDNDGWLDIFVAHRVRGVDRVAKDYLDRSHSHSRPRLYRNLDGGRFEDVTEDTGLDRVIMSMGANFGDLDNDGFPDAYFGTGEPGFEALLPNVLLHNQSASRFHDVTASAALGHLGKGHGVSFGDIDNDGDQDIYHQLGGMFPGDRSRNALFENPGYGRHWLTVRLVGVTSNRAAIGTRLRLLLDGEGEPREVYATVGSGGSFGASSLQQEIGLGDARRVRVLEVWWPTTGARQIFRDLDADQVIEITEGVDVPRTLRRRRIELAGRRDSRPDRSTR